MDLSIHLYDRQVGREMQAGHNGELPAPAIAKVERQRTKNQFEDRFKHGHLQILLFPVDFTIDGETTHPGLSYPENGLGPGLRKHALT